MDLRAELVKRYGFVRRARGCYLYTEKGVRLTDCFLDGGRALLGWDGGKARTVFKDTLERGATGTFDAGMKSRAETAVRKLLPAEYSIIRFWGIERARVIDLKNAFSFSTISLAEAPVCRSFLDITATVEPRVTGYPEITVQHSWLSALLAAGKELPPVIRLIPPFPWAGAPDVYAFRAEVAGDGSFPVGTLPENDGIPSALYAAYARAFYDLLLAFGERTEAQFARFTRQLAPAFDRKACYLFPKIAREKYDAFVLACLDAGVVLSPDYDTPSIVPYGANLGDLKKIAAAYEQTVNV